jgi:hypothetical protein
MPQSSDKIVFVDVSARPALAKVVREGYNVPAAVVDRQKADFFIGELISVTAKEQPRVVSQSVAAGTRVTQGAVIDLVLAPKDSIPFEIIQDAHADFKGKAISAADVLLDDPKFRETILKYDTSGAVPAVEKLAVVAALAKSNIRVNEGDPELTFDKAFQTVRSAAAFR